MKKSLTEIPLRPLVSLGLSAGAVLGVLSILWTVWNALTRLAEGVMFSLYKTTAAFMPDFALPADFYGVALDPGIFFFLGRNLSVLLPLNALATAALIVLAILLYLFFRALAGLTGLKTGRPRLQPGRRWAVFLLVWTLLLLPVIITEATRDTSPLNTGIFRQFHPNPFASDKLVNAALEPDATDRIFMFVLDLVYVVTDGVILLTLTNFFYSRIGGPGSSSTLPKKD